MVSRPRHTLPVACSAVAPHRGRWAGPIVLALVLAAAAWFAPARAQGAFVGGGVALQSFVLPTISLQAGDVVSPNVEVRATLDGMAFWFYFLDAGVDLLYTTAPAPGPIWYVGGGPQLYYVSLGSLGSTLQAGVHLTGGVELPVGNSTGVYVEIRPAAPISFAGVLVALRAGFNYHF